MEGLQEDVQLYKEMKYQEGYHDGAEGKSPRYPIDDEVQPLVPGSLEVPAEKPVGLTNTADAAAEVSI